MKIASISISALLLMGCTYTAEIDSADLRVSNGYLNTGSAEFGALYRWNSSNNECVFLDDVPFLASDFDPGEPSSLPPAENSLSQGVQLSASAELSVDTDLTPQQEASAAAAILSSYRYTVNNYNTVTVRNTRSRIANLLNGNPGSITTWQIASATSASSPLRFVVIYRGLSAESAALTTREGGEAGVAIDLSQIRSRLQGKIENSAEISFNGIVPPAVVTSYVYKAFINDDGNYDFDVDGLQRDFFMTQVLGRGLCG